ncbi:MAG: hypothetical protein BGO34_09750 [Bacteroidia bacterium 44-10]|nr:MAG: hypothetical protein BGO34_09750 [Bacteroidia bacterium 44-10]
MNQPGKYIIYLFLGLFTAAALMPSCTDGNGPDDLDRPADKVSLSISFQSEQQLKAENGVRANEGGEIDPDVYDRESAVYSLAVLVFDGDKLDGSKFIGREIKVGTDPADKDYETLEEITDISLTAGIRDVYIIANAPDGHFNGVGNFDSFKVKMEDLSNQGMYGSSDGEPTDPNGTPIGGEEPDGRFANLVMSQSFTGLRLNSGAPKHYLGYSGLTDPGVLLDEQGNAIKVELVRLVARVAIQKIAFDLPSTLTFEQGGNPIEEFNHYVDTVFLLNAKTSSSYFPEDNRFTNPLGSFGYGNIPGYTYLKDKFSIPDGTYADYLSIPINFPDYDITVHHAPLWFYAFENKDSESSPTAFVIGVKYQYINPGESAVKTKKVYYPVVINRENPDKEADHDFIKRNNQYGIEVTIKGLGSYMTDYPFRSATLRSMSVLVDTERIMEIDETVGTDLFPWTGNIYK